MNQKLFTDWNDAVADVSKKKAALEAAQTSVAEASEAYQDAIAKATAVKKDLQNELDAVIPSLGGRVRES